MVPEGSHVRAVYLDEENGVLCSDLGSGKILIDCSTIDTASSLQVRDAVRQKFPEVRERVPLSRAMGELIFASRPASSTHLSQAALLELRRLL